MEPPTIVTTRRPTPAAPVPIDGAVPADRAVEPAPAIRVRGLRCTVRDHVLLDDIDLDVPAGALLAVAGPSGAGKSTLLRSLAGLAAPSGGSIDRGEPTHAVGFVPQDDILHRDLPLATTLRYAARLRFPTADLAAIDRSVDDALDLLGLADRREVRVSALSGGQRKRASIAVELLGEPDVCVLDEPTSGLDPTSAAGVVRGLRALTARGVAVVMATHDPAHLEAADHIVLLGPGGHLAFAGPPVEARAAFGVEALVEVFDHLQRLAVPAHPSTERPPAHRARSGGRARRCASRTPRRAGGVRRWAVLTHRTAALLAANRLTLAVLVGSPVLVIAMMVLLFPAGAFDDPARASTTAPQVLFWMAFAAFFFGLTDGLLQIVTERDIVRRERAAGLGATTYLAAKLGVLVPLLVVVCLALVTTLARTDRLGELDAATFATLLFTLVLEATAALALGMLASAAVTDAAQATLALPLLCFPQVLFAGAIVPLAAMSGVAQTLSTPLATRWAFEALGRSLPAAPALDPAAVAYPEVFVGSPVTSWVVLGAGAVVCLAATRWLLDR